MTISNGPSKKNLTVYPPAKILLGTKNSIWGEKEDDIDQFIHQILRIDMFLALITLEEHIVISNFLQNMYSNPFILGDVVIMYDGN